MRPNKEASYLFKFPVYVMELKISNYLCFSLEENQVPNWFHRKMMTLLLGWKWKWIK